MDIVELGEVVENLRELVVECLLSELYLAKIKRADAADSKRFVDDRRSLALGLGKNDVHEIGARRNDLNLFEIIHHHFVDYQASL